MSPVAKGVSFVGGSGGLAAGGVGIKALLDVAKPVTLEGKTGYESNQASSKFGAKYAAHLLSNDDNQEIWEKRVVEIAEGTELTGHLQEAYTSAKAWKDESDNTEKSNKFTTAVSKLQTSCKIQYDKSDVSKPSSEAEKWNEVWTYCSVDKKEHWEETKAN